MKVIRILLVAPVMVIMALFVGVLEAPGVGGLAVSSAPTHSSRPVAKGTPSGWATPSAPGSTTSSQPSTPPASSGAPVGGEAVPAATVQRCLRQAGAAGCPTRPTVYLTIDDGPSAWSTPQYLEILRRYGIHATFFVTGRQTDSVDPAVLRRVVADGNKVGVHSWSHDYDLLYPGRRGNAANVQADTERALASIRRVLGPDFTTGAYRYPGGHMSWKNLAPADEALQQMGLSWIDWNSMFGDAEPTSRRPTTAAGMVEMATSEAANCGNNTVVVLLHDGPNAKLSIEAMPQVIEWFAAHGYQFGTIA